MPRLVAVPTTELPLLEQTVSLEGKSFTMTFDWSARTNAWSVQIDDEAGTTLTSGGLLTFGVDLFRHVASEARPGGRLVVLTFPDAVTPDLVGIADTELVYYSAQELEDAGF